MSTARIEGEAGYRAVCPVCGYRGDLTEYIYAADDADDHTCPHPNAVPTTVASSTGRHRLADELASFLTDGRPT